MNFSNVTDNMQKICISIQPGIPLRGDILIKCYHKKIRSGQREVMWRTQFHTCAISDYSLIFSKSELDDGSIGRFKSITVKNAIMGMLPEKAEALADHHYLALDQ